MESDGSGDGRRKREEAKAVDVEPRSMCTVSRLTDCLYIGGAKVTGSCVVVLTCLVIVKQHNSGIVDPL